MDLPFSSILPEVVLRNLEEFVEVRRLNEDYLGRCYLTEVGLATNGDAVLCQGACAICLGAAEYTSPAMGGEVVQDGRRMPKWRDHQRCSCDLHLSFCERAALHVWSRLPAVPAPRVLVIGHVTRVGRWLERRGCEVTEVFGQDMSARRDVFAAGGFDTVICLEYLDQVPDAVGLLGLMREALRPGGFMLLTTALHYTSATSSCAEGMDPSSMRSRDSQMHNFGWDFIELVRSAGFSDAGAIVPWSQELGYLGLFNFIFIGAHGSAKIPFASQGISDE